MQSVSVFPQMSSFHADRAAGGHRHHRHPRRHAAARFAAGPGQGEVHLLHQQLQPVRQGGGHVRRRQQGVSAFILEPQGRH